MHCSFPVTTPIWRELPLLVAMADKLPKKHAWDRETNIGEDIVVSAAPPYLRVATKSGSHVLEQCDFSQAGENAKFLIADRLADWTRVLTSTRAPFAVLNDA